MIRTPRFVITIILAVACACVPKPNYLPSVTVISTTDFRPYAERGFLFTPEAYTGDYIGIGYLRIDHRPEAFKGETAVPGIYGDAKTAIYFSTAIDLTAILDTLYVIATSMGADAVMNLRMRNEYHPVTGYLVAGIEISGFAIKRKGAFEPPEDDR